MPGLKELEQFRNELSNLGGERQVTAERGEVYDELPLPSEIPQSAPDIAVDDLLSSLDGLGPYQSEGFVPPDSSDDLLSLLDNLPGNEPASPAPNVPPSAVRNPAAPAPEAPDAPDAGEFDDLLASLDLGDMGLPGETASPSAAPSVPSESEPQDAAGFDDFAIPENLLAGFADEVTESRKEADSSAGDFEIPSFDMGESEPVSGFGDELPPVPESPSVPGADFSGFDSSDLEPLDLSPGLEDVPSFGEPEEIGPADVAAPESFDLGLMDLTPNLEMDLSPETETDSVEDLGLAPVDDFEPVQAAEDADETLFPGFSSGAEGEPSADFSTPGDFSVPPADFGDEGFTAPSFDIGSIPPPGEAAGVDDFSDFSIPADLDIGDASSSSSEPAPIDGFDGFSLDDDVLKGGFGETGAGGDDFNIPGFSDFTSGPARPAISELPGGLSGGKKGVKKEVPLSVSEADFEKFLDILASYPLNLRIGIEEFLSGDSGTDTQKMELVHSILNKASIHKIARVVGDYLNRTISVPKDYEKKSAEEYEREKSSLRYVLINRILPAAILFSIVAVLSACVFFLGWKFVYTPLVAEDLYKRGYSAIEDGRYTQSLEFFDRAVRVYEKKPWYYKYARGFREHKQYISAELMYERIIARFNKDKQGYLEYGEMLRTDLRNFEKAENVIKRQFLVDFVNDQDGLMLLGDTYLDWAEEDGSKYEAARQTYATLIELYGPLDPFLARMMRYFIRTDNLKEVLPLKEHFKAKNAKIGASDLVELGGYLLQKRYEPKAGDSEALRDRIDDLRNFLERAIKADPSIPEAHYNIGRFFIYNYKNDLASSALKAALDRFDHVSTMSPKRVLSHVDAYRLLGECLVADKEFLDAQSLFAKGITLYEEQRANRAVSQDSRVGRLYADYADIDYFVSNDLDNAYHEYSRAVNELWDTPSIRYRIGYIDYQKQKYESAMEEFALVHASVDSDRSLLYSYGNTLFRRGDYYAAQGFYERLMDDLEAERTRKGIIFPQARIDHALFVEEYMRASNNFGVILNRLAQRTGDSKKNARAVAMFSESARAWDALTRNPETLIRAPGTNLAFLNIQNIAHPLSTYESEIYADIPKTLVGEKVLQQKTDE
jgi:tetratricopeptide (TPR) repeat protein